MLTSEFPVLSVSQAIEACNGILRELVFQIEGEVANFTMSRGKFIFFDLKDEEAEARLGCFMMAYQLQAPLEDGMRVLVTGRPGLYQKNGGFRITVQKAEPKGEGSLKRSFELLKKKLEAEGLFAPERKRSLPRFVQSVGIISSKEAAGFGDFRKIGASRFLGVEYYFVNVAVQGRDAEPEICQAFDYLNSHYQLDAIVLIRGGGSLEDLHAFNNEAVARAIARSKAPVVVGVGHERDVTIADYVADVRAATPSNAAQLLLPSQQELEELVKRLMTSGEGLLKARLTQKREAILYSRERIANCLQVALTNVRTKTNHVLKTINTTSPTAILDRGFSITCTEAGATITSINQVQPGDLLLTRVRDGQIQSTVNI